MIKRVLDIVLAAAILLLASPLLLVLLLLIWAADGAPPIYRGLRVGRGGRDFAMLKLRSMVPDAERNGRTSTPSSDERLTLLGPLLRRWKLDELPQLWNVLRGQMSLVGPRPNVRRGGVDNYTLEEMRLLRVRPGITDLASIVFFDEGEILADSADPDALYDILIRPWKSQLGLLYIGHASVGLDLRILWLTALALISRQLALGGVVRILHGLGADPALTDVCRRVGPLPTGRPPAPSSAEKARCGSIC